MLQHVDSIFNIVCNEWGYRYLKLDFNVEPGPNRYRSITSFEAIRNMYKVIREAVGPNVFIANCAGSPYPPSIGIAQAGRVGPDVNPNWPSVIRGCERSLHHIPFHRRWWVNDPDCLNTPPLRATMSARWLTKVSRWPPSPLGTDFHAYPSFRLSFLSTEDPSVAGAKGQRTSATPPDGSV